MSGSELRRALLALLVALALPATSRAQPQTELGTPILHNYPPKVTSGINQVWTIVQDRRGILYFGSATQIGEYDGVTWRYIPVPTTAVRSMAVDGAGKIWVGGNGAIGTLESDANGNMRYVSFLDQIPPEHRQFHDVWQILVTPQATYFRSYDRIFRWDGQHLHAFASKSQFQALSLVRARIYTSEVGVGLEEIVGDEVRALPGGDAYKNSTKLF